MSVQMHQKFSEILSIKGVVGVAMLSRSGRVVFQAAADTAAWQGIDALNLAPCENLQEADLFFEHLRLYVRPAGGGFFLVAMHPEAPAAMVRLNCDTLFSNPDGRKKPKKAGWFFKKRAAS